MKVNDFIIEKLEKTIEKEKTILNDREEEYKKQKIHYFPLILTSFKKGFIWSFFVEFTMFMFTLYLFSMVIVSPIAAILLRNENIDIISHIDIILYYSSILFLIMSFICFCIPEKTIKNDLYCSQKEKIEMANKTLEKIKEEKYINKTIELLPLFSNQIATQEDLEFASKYIKEEDFISLLVKSNNKINLFDLINNMMSKEIK